MAIIKGVHERVHLPLYDSFFVRPATQLRELATSSALKFFVNIQGKTKLETNMQQSSLLPHWNTFEARALRVVISDLPAIFPQAIESCLKGSNGTTNGGDAKVSLCLEDVEELRHDCDPEISSEQVAKARVSLHSLQKAADQARRISDDIEACLGLLRRFCDPDGIGRILKMQSNLRSIRQDLAAVLKRTRVSVNKANEVSRFVEELEQMETKGEEYDLLRRMGEAKACLDALVQLCEFFRRIKDEDLTEVSACVAAAEKLVKRSPARIQHLNDLKQCITEAVAEISRLKGRLRDTRGKPINACLDDALGNKLLMPLDEQLSRSSTEILAKLIYNSVTTLFVGEKIMIQMPTWFFPAGAGPYSDDGRAVTHGFPMPQATFNFAEPVFIGTQQNFRVEIEFPEAGAIEDLRCIYGPFFIWVVLDGYMTRDVQ